MADAAFAMGWGLSMVAWLWIALIVAKLAFGWLSSGPRERPGLGARLGRLVDAPVNLVRRTVPTLYRRVDFAPWITLLLLVLVKTLVLRALVYWGMLQHTPIGS